jgi:hypothetical protein
MASSQRMFRETATGGRRLAAAATLFVLMQVSGAVAEQSPGSLTVREEKGVYTVSARFLVDQPPSVALTVLTDYEQIPRFMPMFGRALSASAGLGGPLWSRRLCRPY